MTVVGTLSSDTIRELIGNLGQRCLRMAAVERENIVQVPV